MSSSAGTLDHRGAGVSPVALHTAVLSIAGFGAIQERVKHLGVQTADLRLLRSQAVVGPPSRVWTA